MAPCLLLVWDQRVRSHQAEIKLTGSNCICQLLEFSSRMVFPDLQTQLSRRRDGIAEVCFSMCLQGRLDMGRDIGGEASSFDHHVVFYVGMQILLLHVPFQCPSCNWRRLFQDASCVNTRISAN